MYSFYRFATVKMGIHLCYKWDKPKSMVKVAFIIFTAVQCCIEGFHLLNIDAILSSFR